MKRRLWIWLCLIIMVCTFPKLALAKDTNSDITWSMLSDISNKIFLYTDNGNIKEAQTMVELFSKKWSEVVPGTIKINNKDLRVVNVTYDQLEQAFSNHPNNTKALKDAATEFRLVIDALSSKNDPMWKDMGSKVIGQFHDVEQAARSGNNDSFQNQLNQFLDDYKIIYPALVIDIDPVTLAKLDGEIQRLSNGRMKVFNNKAYQNQLNKIITDLNSLFGYSKKQTAPNVLWTSIAIASIIILTLIYVSWRKYTGEYRVQAYKYF